jgi:hypothetical protein
LFIIVFHQCWRNVAAVLMSVFVWVLAPRRLVLLAAPKLYERAGEAMAPIPSIFAFGAIAAMRICGPPRQACFTDRKERSAAGPMVYQTAQAEYFVRRAGTGNPPDGAENL